MFKKILISTFVMLNTINCNCMETINIDNNMEIDEEYSDKLCQSNTSFNTFDFNNPFSDMHNLPLPTPNDIQQSEPVQEDIYTNEKANTFIKNYEKENKIDISNEDLVKAIPMFGKIGVDKLLYKYIDYSAKKMDKQIDEERENKLEDIIDIKNILRFCYCSYKTKTNENYFKYLESIIQKLHYNNVVLVSNRLSDVIDNSFRVIICINPYLLTKKLVYTFTNTDNIALSNLLNIIDLTKYNNYYANYIRHLLLDIISNNEVISNPNFSFVFKSYINSVDIHNYSIMIDSINQKSKEEQMDDNKKVVVKKMQSIINNINLSNLFDNDILSKENEEWNVIFDVLYSQDYSKTIKDILINNSNKELIVNILNINVFSDIIKYRILEHFIRTIFKEMSKNNTNEYKIQINNVDDNETEEDKLYFIKNQSNINKHSNITNNNIVEDKKIDYYFLNDFLPLLNEDNFYNIIEIISSYFDTDIDGSKYYRSYYSYILENNVTDLLIKMMFSKFNNNSCSDNEDIIRARQRFVDNHLRLTMCDKENTIELFKIINNDNTGKSKYTEVFIDGMIKLIIENNDSDNFLLKENISNLKELSYMLNDNIKLLFRSKMQFIIDKLNINNIKSEFDINNVNTKCNYDISKLEECFQNILNCMNKKI